MLLRLLTGIDTGKKPVHGGTEIVSRGFFQWSHKVSEFQKFEVLDLSPVYVDYSCGTSQKNISLLAVFVCLEVGIIVFDYKVWRINEIAREKEL